MKIEIGKRAQRQILRISNWWHEQADDPLLFENELEKKLRELLDMASLGVPYPTERRPHLMRLLLPKSEYHVYFSLERDGTLIEVHSVWGARRGRSPIL